jgi:hypothetical protein
MSINKKLFLSIVSSEFASYRQLLSSDLKRPSLDIAVQEDFVVSGGKTLEKLDTYIRHCDAVIHLIGKATGSMPEEHAVAALLRTYPDFATRLPPLADALRKPQPGFSYTHWEAYLAIYHRRPLFVYLPTDFELDTLVVPRDQKFVLRSVEVQSQKEHYARIAALGHDRGQFLNQERLSSAVLRDLVEILPRLESATKVDISRIGKYAPAELIGREAELKLLDNAWAKVRNHEAKRPHILTFVALGGEGKTSLVAKWATALAHQDWSGCDAAFAWSFYSQGTREQVAAASDLFLKEALAFFGDTAIAESAQAGFEKGRRLAQLVGERRALLILDGLEPLQCPPGPPMDGKLKDDGLAALLKGLAARSDGLCVVTTRYSLPDLRAWWQTTAPEAKLTRLPRAAGVALLQSMGVKGSLLRNIPCKGGTEQVNEFEKLVEDVQGHALTLNLLGTYLRDAHAGDIRRRDLVRLEEADAEEQGGHAFRVMDAYAQSFAAEGERGQRALALLRLLGLFDRPASADCLGALLHAPAIPGLTEPLVGLTEAQLNVALSRLESARLITRNPDDSALRHPTFIIRQSLDAHPLLREYFGRQLRTHHPKGWRAAHRRLYKHLCATTKEGNQPALEDLQPLYQAVAHGCQAGAAEKTRIDVYRNRILRGNEQYSLHKLGAFGSDLEAIGCFFEQPWTRIMPGIREQAWLLHQAGYCLRAVGRLADALEPIRLACEIDEQPIVSRCIMFSFRSELELALGQIIAAVQDAERCVEIASRDVGAWLAVVSHATIADALHHQGQRDKADKNFRLAEHTQGVVHFSHPWLFSLAGFQYCELLLADAERAAWGQFLDSPTAAPVSHAAPACSEVEQRMTRNLKAYERASGVSLLDVALCHLSLERAKLYRRVLELSAIKPQSAAFEACGATSVAQFKVANSTHHLPRALLTRAWLRFLTGARIGAESAQSDLDEAWEIAERGPMKLFLADIHLHRARLFFREQAYPWKSVRDDLAAAEKLINECGYHRRDEELADAKLAILGK